MQTDMWNTIKLVFIQENKGTEENETWQEEHAMDHFTNIE